MPYTQSGKCGGIVWSRNRYGEISYLLVIPANPRTEAQMTVRGNFGTTSKRWRILSEKQRRLWERFGCKHKSRKRLGQCGPLCGFYYYMKVNVARANQGLAPLELPPEYLRPRPPRAPIDVEASSFALLPVGPTFFLQAQQLLAAAQRAAGPTPAPAHPLAA